MKQNDNNRKVALKATQVMPFLILIAACTLFFLFQAKNR